MTEREEFLERLLRKTLEDAAEAGPSGQDAAVRTAVAAVLAHEAETPAQDDEPGSFVRELLADPIDEYAIRARMNTLEFDPGLLRAVICVSLDYRQNRYFNINLNLGYQSSSERIRREIIERIREGKYFNSQDICVGYGADEVLVVKTFQASSDKAKVHQALDRICEDIAALLAPMRALSYGMACGNAYLGPERVRESYREAREIITIGRQALPAGEEEKNGAGGYFKLNDIMFDTVCRHLNPLTRTNVIDPYLDLLPLRDGKIQKEIIDCGELFVDCCMNIAEVSKAGYLHRNTIAGRLRKLEELTGLSPARSFRDAFIVKMLAVHIRQNGL